MYLEIRIHTYIHSIVEMRRNNFDETIKIIVCKSMRRNNLVVLEFVISNVQNLRFN